MRSCVGFIILARSIVLFTFFMAIAILAKKTVQQRQDGRDGSEQARYFLVNQILCEENKQADKSQYDQ